MNNLCYVIWLFCVAFSLVQAQLRDPDPDIRREPVNGRIEFQSGLHVRMINQHFSHQFLN